MDLWAPQMIADFFGNDVLQDAEEFFHHKEEEEEKPIQEETNGTLPLCFFHLSIKKNQPYVA